jgi:hypothetical protein
VRSSASCRPSTAPCSSSSTRSPPSAPCLWPPPRAGLPHGLADVDAEDGAPISRNGPGGAYGPAADVDPPRRSDVREEGSDVLRGDLSSLPLRPEKGLDSPGFGSGFLSVSRRHAPWSAHSAVVTVVGRAVGRGRLSVCVGFRWRVGRTRSVQVREEVILGLLGAAGQG